MLVLLRLAFLSLKSRKTATILTVFSIALSVLLLTGIDRVRQAAQQGFACTLSQTDLVVGARGGSLPLLLYAVFHAGVLTNDLSFASYEHFRDHPAVQWTIPFSMAGSHHGYRVMATDGNFYEHYRYHHDRAIEFAGGSRPEGIFDAAIGSEVAKRLGYHVGSKIIFSYDLKGISSREGAGRPFTVTGILARTETPVDRAVYITLYGNQAMHLEPTDSTQITPAAIRKEDLHIKNIGAFLIRTRSQVDTQQLQREVNAYLQEPLTAIIPARTLQELWGLLGYADMALSVVSGAVLVVGLLALLITLYAALNERRREVAILRANGFHVWQIFILFVLESTLISVAGAALGLAAAFGLLWVVRAPIEMRFGIPLAMVGFSWRVSLYACMVVLAGTLLGCLPANRAYRNGLIDGLNAQ